MKIAEKYTHCVYGDSYMISRAELHYFLVWKVIYAKVGVTIIPCTLSNIDACLCLSRCWPWYMASGEALRLIAPCEKRCSKFDRQSEKWKFKANQGLLSCSKESYIFHFLANWIVFLILHYVHLFVWLPIDFSMHCIYVFVYLYLLICFYSLA